MSGFSGLIYESIWSHYLKLFLGHAAYAQTLVIAIFMGGLALGSLVCSKYSLRWKNVLLLYALAEGIIGLFALGFHNVFVAFTSYSYNEVIPALGSPALVTLYKWTTSSLLILPQSILLGMTFPLMSAGIIRLFPRKPGESLSVLYFTNSFGAAIGILVSGFFLIRSLGLPGSMTVAAVMNIIIAVVVGVTIYLLRSTVLPGDVQQDIDVSHEGAGVKADAALATDKESSVASRYLLIIAFVTGLASFVYEISWIRMLSLVLSSSTHAFELMLSAFIFGLAFGGYWIKRRIDQLENPARFLAVIQIVMGMFALSTLILYNHTFDFMQSILQVLSRTEEAYGVFNFSSHLIALAIMLPTTFCAGMTLPLITYTLIRQGNGEKSIGAVYASNTLGAIVGVFFAVHIGMPLLGLQYVVSFAAALDIALGLLLLWYLSTSVNKTKVSYVIAGCIVIFISVNLLTNFDSYKMASGVYRQGKLIDAEKVQIKFHKDGKTASIDLLEYANNLLSIRTNGKSDAAINMSPDNPASRDEATMVLAAAVPLALKPDAKTVANIGMGSGLTAHTLLTAPWLETVDTIEIEQAVVDAAQGFRPRVELVYSDPRSHIHIEDAKTFFSSRNKQYDIIVSEPSNPWVSGVSGLFSDEFYHIIKRYMTRDGLLVQWLQLYEIDINLVASVMKAFSQNFSDYVVYASDENNILIVGKKEGVMNAPDFRVFEEYKLAKELNIISVNNNQDFNLHKVGSKKALDPFFNSFRVPANSDYYPVLDQNAAKARFLGLNAEDVVKLANAPLPIIAQLEQDVQQQGGTQTTYNPYFMKSVDSGYAIAIRNFVMQGRPGENDLPIPEDVRKDLQYIKTIFNQCDSVAESEGMIDSLLNIAVTTIPYLSAEELSRLWQQLQIDACADNMTAEQNQWVMLINAISHRNNERTRQISVPLLAAQNPANVMRFGYLLMAGMLSNLALDDRQSSLKLWNRYSTHIYGKSQLDMLLLLLAAHSSGATDASGVTGVAP